MKKFNLKKVILTIVCWAATLIFLFPLIWFSMLSIKHPQLTFATPPVFLFVPTFEAYREVIFEGAVIQQLLNSIIIAGGSTIACLILGIPAAYAFARFRFRLRRNLLFGFLSVRMAPPIAILLPFYLLMREFDLVGTRTSLILINLIVNLPLVIWLMRDFLNEVPESLDEMAMVDGCSRFQAFLRVVLPLAAPGIVVCTVFAFIFAWNEFLFALVFSNAHTQPLTVGATSFWTNAQLEWHKLAAVATITALPPLFLSFFLGKFLIRGLTFGAIKG